MEGLGALGACVELTDVEKGLKGERFTMKEYMRTVFGQSERTAWRRLADYRELRTHWSEKVIESVVQNGLRGASGIGVRDLINVAKALPAPKSRDEKVIEGFINTDVREKIRSQRQDRGKGKTLTFTEAEAAKMALNAMLRYIRSVNLETSAQKRKWLTRVMGWVLEGEAVSGTMRVGRISIPDGVIIKRGRPRKKPKE